MVETLLSALERAVEIGRAEAAGQVPVIGISGAQGAGKTTLLAAFAATGVRVAGLSIDDVYLTRAERSALARDVHPLLVTRGPPGTHDLALLAQTLESLQRGGRTALPSFDKAADDRRPESEWLVFEGQPDVIVLDGWCIGARAQALADLEAPVNPLEAGEDPDELWRTWVNDRLAGPYQRAFEALDAILFLAAPSFDVVLDWRLQQEAGTLGRAMGEADRARIARFVAHYERITRHMLAGGVRAEVRVNLNERREMLS